MQLGVVFPQTEIGNDQGAIRTYAQTVELMGFDYLLAYEHVLGAHPDRLRDLGREPPYTHESPFHEPFVLFGFLAPHTWGEAVEVWRSLGGTHLAVNTTRCGFKTADDRLEALRRFRGILDNPKSQAKKARTPPNPQRTRVHLSGWWRRWRERFGLGFRRPWTSCSRPVARCAERRINSPCATNAGPVSRVLVPQYASSADGLSTVH